MYHDCHDIRRTFLRQMFCHRRFLKMSHNARPLNARCGISPENCLLPKSNLRNIIIQLPETSNGD